MQLHGYGNGQGNALVGRSKQDVEFTATPADDGVSVEVGELGDLLARAVLSGVDEERRAASALCGEVPKGEHFTADHELDEALLVVFHGLGALAPRGPGCNRQRHEGTRVGLDDSASVKRPDPSREHRSGARTPRNDPSRRDRNAPRRCAGRA